MLLATVLCYIKSDVIYYHFALPLLRALPDTQLMIATNVMSPFLVPLKLSVLCSVIISMPYFLYELWLFVAPGLYRREKKIIFPMLLASCMLFYLGMLFAFLVIIPGALKFFATCVPQGLVMMTDVTNYMDFVGSVLLASGIAFQVPIVTIVLVKWQLISYEQLAAKRPLVVVLAFTIAMLLTPPDVISQVLLAVPMCGLFELGLVFAKPKN